MIELDPTLAIVDASYDTQENDQPFGKRWGDEVMTLTAEHLAALHDGKLVAVDVQGEYVVFLRLQNESNPSGGREICPN
jgi:hypothetical protein